MTERALPASPSAVAVRDDRGPFRILHVCVGNICRSVLAERLTRLEAQARIGRHSNRVQVSSAGTRARPGASMHPHAATTLRALGADPDHSAARRLTPELVAGADLILTATVDERDEVLSLAPAAIDRTFTLREFARLSGHLPPPDPATPTEPGDVVSTVLRMRGRAPAGSYRGDDIADPRRTLPAFQACAELIADAVRRVMSALLLPPA